MVLEPMVDNWLMHRFNYRIVSVVTVPLLLFLLFFAIFSPAKTIAAPYGEGSYNATCYENCEATPSESGGTSTTAQTPNTGIKSENLQWAMIAGIIGVVVLSMAIVRFLNAKRARN